jgi:ribosome-associated translation inhibitor RaiA
MRVFFKNLDKSELALEAVEERLGDMVEKFPKLAGQKLTVTLSMENSPTRAGPDSFTVKILVETGEYAGIKLAKSAPSLYLALADVREHLLEALNRAGDRERVLKRGQERKFRSAL